MADSPDSRDPIGGSISRLISVAVLIVIIAAIGILFYRVMIGFFIPLFLAALLVVIFRPLHIWFEKRLGHRRRLAAGLTTTTILLIVLIPSGLVLSIAAAQSTRLLSGVNSQTLTLALVRARKASGLMIQSPDTFDELKLTIDRLSIPDDEAQTRRRIDRTAHLLDELKAAYPGEPDDRAERTGRFQRIDTLLEALRGDLAAVHGEEPQRKPARLPSDAPEPDLGSGPAPANPSANPSVNPSDPAPDDPSDNPAVAATTTGPASDRPATGPPASSRPTVPADAAPREPDEPAAQEEEEEETNVPPVLEYQSTLVQLHEASESLMTSLLGGTVLSQLKWMANPSDEDIQERLQQIRLYVQRSVANVASTTTEYLFRTVLGIVVLIIAVYFFLIDGPTMTRTLMQLSPLDDRYEERLLMQFDRTSRAVVLATILSALAQGILAAAGYYVAGLDSVVLLFLATTFMALIPFVGALAVWLPCALWLGFVDQRWTAAIVLALYGALIVSTIDNVIKVLILHGGSHLHPLLALLSVLGGVQVFGPIGLLVGPMIVVFLQSLLEILNQELARADAEQKPSVDGS